MAGSMWALDAWLPQGYGHDQHSRALLMPASTVKTTGLCCCNLSSGNVVLTSLKVQGATIERAVDTV